MLKAISAELDRTRFIFTFTLSSEGEESVIPKSRVWAQRERERETEKEREAGCRKRRGERRGEEKEEERRKKRRRERRGGQAD